ncbi:polymer-forming cytoskeletal protein [Methanosarcina sp. MSH10X1]|uniref:polymer-forming cytoskeletal protein n=1 Tax=Methanosarcina sp. MSH10X1 TaxID=2507075 RepID=UPI001F0BE345|nr:polymer-forming cytoskeletal protein [Methanosarcina sp. MSH10X1]
MGEGVSVSGDIAASSDIRIDMWSKMGSRVEVGRNAYLGEFVTIDGKLLVEGDLDVGKEVKIRGGFEAKGWIVVRNPVPVIIFLFLYIREMMRLGKGEEIEKAVEELFDDSEEIQGFEGKEPGENILIIPAGAKLSPETIEVTGGAVIGNNCLLIGNIRAQAVETGKKLTLKGSIYSESKIDIGENGTVYGNLYSKGQVQIGRNSRVFGGIKADSVLLHENARVDGTIKAPSGVSFLRDAAEKPVLAEVNALGKVIMRETHELPEYASQDEPVKALNSVEIDSPVKQGAKAGNTFVPGRKRKTARTRALERSRRFTGARAYRKEQKSGE